MEHPPPRVPPSPPLSPGPPAGDPAPDPEPAAARAAAEPQVRAALELMPQLVWTATPDGSHDYYNARWYDYTGMPRPGDPAAGADGPGAEEWSWKAYLHPDDYARTLARWADCLATGAPYEAECRFKAATGRYRWFLARALPQRDEAGRVVRWVGTCTDVDEQRRAAEQLQEQAVELELTGQQLQEQQAELEAQAEALHEANANLEAALADAVRARRAADAARARTGAVLEAMADAYFALDADFRVVAVNAAMARGSGLARDALLGRDFWALFPGAVGTAFERHYRAAAAGAEAHFTHDYSDGRLDLVVEVDAYPAAGGGVAVFWRDVTARVRAEAAVRASEAKYRALFDAMDQGFCLAEVLVDDAGAPADYRFVEVNPAFARQTGLADAAGRTARDLVPGLEQHWVDAYGRVALSGEPARFAQGSEAMGRWFDVFAFRVGAPAERRVAILFTDVSAARAAERERERLVGALEVERSRLAAVFAAAPSVLAVVRGPDHVFELANEAYLRLIGRRDVVGRPLLEAVPELRGQGFDGLLAGVVATGEPYVGREVPIGVAPALGAPVEERFFDFVYLPLEEVDGAGDRRAVGVIAHGTDITDQVRARREAERLLAEREAALAALAASERRARTIAENATLALFVMDEQQRCTYMNPAAERLTGYTLGELQGRPLHDYVHHTRPDGTPYPLAECPIDQAFPQNMREQGTEVFVHRDGTFYPVAFTASPIRDERTGAPVGTIIEVRDVRAEQAAAAERERLLAESEAARAAADLERRRLLATLDQLPVGVHVAEAPGGRLVLGNAAVRRLWGGAPASARVEDYSADYVGYHRAGPRAGQRVASDAWPMARALGAGAVVEGEVFDVARSDGTRVLVSVSAAPVRDAGGRVVGAVATSVDVTEREHLLAESERARQAAEAANAAKGQFLANMSHELRTPLNAIGGYVQLLDMGLHGPVTGDQRAALARVQAAQTRLLALINDVLNYAKLEAGRVQYDLRAVDVADVVRDVVPLVEPQVRAKGLAFDVRLPAAPCVVAADREKLGQVLLNLLSNAVKFTPSPDPRTGAPGRVTVSVALGEALDEAPAPEAAGPDGGRPALVFVRVADTGVGIPPEKQEAIFEPFVQVRAREASYAQATEGTGLGLAISRDLARGMGGDLRVRSAPGEGATFTVALRRAAHAPPTEGAGHATDPPRAAGVEGEPAGGP